MSLSATVAGFEWANPHVYIQIETQDDASSPTRWLIEAGPPNLMARADWSARSLAVGETVAAAVHPLRRGGRNIALGNSIMKQDGTFLPIRGAALPAELSTADGTALIAADDIFGRWTPVWNPELASRFLSPESGWSVTEAGRVAMESYALPTNSPKSVTSRSHHSR